jgi:hypothetical protein
MSTPCLRTLDTFSNFCLNTQKSANIKVVQNLVGHISSLRWHLKFRGEIVQKLKSNFISFVLGAMKVNDFACSSCSNHGSKHRSTCTKDDLLCPLYNFPFWRIWSSIWKFWIWGVQTAFVLFLVALALPCPLYRRDVKDWSTCCNKCVASLLGLVFVSHLVTSDEGTLQVVSEP